MKAWRRYTNIELYIVNKVHLQIVFKIANIILSFPSRRYVFTEATQHTHTYIHAVIHWHSHT